MQKTSVSNPPGFFEWTFPLRLDLSRTARFLVIYSVGLALSLWLAYGIRFDFDVPWHQRAVLPRMLLGVVPLQLFWLHCFGQFHLLPAYFDVRSLARMFWALFIAAVVLALIRWQFGTRVAPPYGVILADFLLALALLSAFCLSWRLYREGSFDPILGRRTGARKPRRVGIMGAGSAGLSLARELRAHPELGVRPVAFFDDDRSKWNGQVMGIPVLGPPELVRNGIVKRFQLEEVILSLPSAPARRVRELVELLRGVSLNYRTVPSIGELAQGKYQVTHLRSVQIEDLLGRDPVRLQDDAIRDLLQGRCVMVTGAGGSIGSELCRQLAAHQPAQLLLVDRSEVQMFVIEQELIRAGHKAIVRPLLADILNETRLRQIFDSYPVEVVFHAAAHKHVPLMEQQPDEAIRNNSFGTARLAELALEYGVDRFVMISTDKAINPTSVMGASKRLAEMFIQALAARHPGHTRFMAVRFGNVLGSSGSVIPVFREQIAAGGPVTVTHPDMVRYFMTIPEAVGLVLQSSVQGEGGEIFVLDMGQPVRIVDLATQMIRLSGLEPDEDIRIEFVGVRPGEKLFEEISYSDEAVSRTAHPKILRLRAAPPDLDELRGLLRELAPRLIEPASLKPWLHQAVPEYRPASPLPGP